MNSKRALTLSVLLLAAQQSIGWAQNNQPTFPDEMKATVVTPFELKGNACGKEVQKRTHEEGFWHLEKDFEFYIRRQGLDIHHKLQRITQGEDEEMEKPAFYPFNDGKPKLKKHPCDVSTSFKKFPFVFSIQNLLDEDGTTNPHVLIIVPVAADKDEPPFKKEQFYLLVSSVRTSAECDEIPWYHPIMARSCKSIRQLTDMQSTLSPGVFYREVLNRMDDIRWSLVPVTTKMHNGVIHGNL